MLSRERGLEKPIIPIIIVDKNMMRTSFFKTRKKTSVYRTTHTHTNRFRYKIRCCCLQIPISFRKFRTKVTRNRGVMNVIIRIGRQDKWSSWLYTQTVLRQTRSFCPRGLVRLRASRIIYAIGKLRFVPRTYRIRK